MTDPGVMWHPDGLTRFDPSPKKLIIDHTPYVIPRAAYTIGNMLSRAAGVCTDLCQVVRFFLKPKLSTLPGMKSYPEPKRRAYCILASHFLQSDTGLSLYLVFTCLFQKY